MDIDFDELLAGEDVVPDASSASRAQAEHAALLASLDRQARSRQLAVPTNETAVRQRLRDLGEPQTMFGERPEDRRDRLRAFMARLAEERGWDVEEASSEDEEDEEEEEEFYTEGGEELLDARRKMAEWSLAKARERVERQRREAALPLSRIMATRKAVFGELKARPCPTPESLGTLDVWLQTYTNLGSQVGDERSVSMVRFSPNSQLLATGSWTGTAKIWSVPSCNLFEAKGCKNTFRGGPRLLSRCRASRSRRHRRRRWG